jgi:hypothetical protein
MTRDEFEQKYRELMYGFLFRAYADLHAMIEQRSRADVERFKDCSREGMIMTKLLADARALVKTMSKELPDEIAEPAKQTAPKLRQNGVA